MVKQQERYALYRGNWGAAGEVQHFAYNEVNAAVTRIEEAVGEPDCQKEAIVLIGHSYGGDAALTAARQLNSKGYKVQFIATLDPVTDTMAALWGTTSTTRKPPKIGTGWNWYQTQTVPFGSSIPGLGDDNVHWNKDGDIIVNGSPAGHREIDDDVAIRDRIRQRAIQEHANYKPPQ